MGELEDSINRHPAGKAQKETIWDTVWAITKAMQLGREQEQERIIKLLKELGVLRDSMISQNCYVIYSENGALDLSKDRLEGKE